MARHTVSTMLASLLLARPALGAMTGWWTWMDQPTPHFALQDMQSGDIYHSACNSNGSAEYTFGSAHKFPLTMQPRKGTPIAAVGWWDTEVEPNAPIASLFFQSEEGALINAYMHCNLTTGEYYFQGDEQEYSITLVAGVTSVHNQSGLSMVELGDAGGYRVHYHAEDGKVNLLAYDDETDWVWRGPVSQAEPSSFVISSTLGLEGEFESGQFSVIAPYDQDNLLLASSGNASAPWNITTIPTPLEGSATNRTSASNMTLDTNEDPAFTLDNFDSVHGTLGLASNNRGLSSILYLGTDKRLHEIQRVDSEWTAREDQGDLWPEADDASAAMAVVSVIDAAKIWVYYFSDSQIVELSQGEMGTWAEPRIVTASDESDNEEGSGSGSGSGETGSGSGSGSNGPNNGADNGGANLDEANNDSTSLSTGARAGLGVGITAAVLLVGALIFMFVRRRNRRAREPSQTPTTPELDSKPPRYSGLRSFYPLNRGSGPGGGGDKWQDAAASKNEMGHDAIELPSPAPPQELAATPHYELSADCELGRDTISHRANDSPTLR